ncbi:MAG: hypothetical protein KDA96_01315, partial [Planctomycetaceae bacterium]|nr:hypothetical protein [Planctomycetaceae bacterium]
DSGYAAASALFRDRLLSLSANQPSLAIDFIQSSVKPQAAIVQDVRWNPAPGILLSLRCREEYLSAASLQVRITGTRMDLQNLVCEVTESDGKRQLLEAVAHLPAARNEPSDGESLMLQGQTSRGYQYLRDLTIQKNELYFHRWRPQNITYLYGFRKHEQGNNAVEIAQFDPLIRQLEKQIQEARAPQWKSLIIRRAE